MRVQETAPARGFTEYVKAQGATTKGGSMIKIGLIVVAVVAIVVFRKKLIELLKKVIASVKGLFVKKAK
jgi:hypothetical protein